MNLDIQKKVSLADHTTLRVGGEAEYFVEVKSKEELLEALKFKKDQNLKVLVLGGGSNLLIGDNGFPGLVIKNSIKGLSIKEGEGEVEVQVGAGENWDKLVKKTTEKGYWGFENLSHIPGTVGATPIQNVGAYGVEVSELIVEVVAVNLSTLEEKTFTNSECQFGYRDSYFKKTEGREWIIIDVTYLLKKTKAPRLDYAAFDSLDKLSVESPEAVRDFVIEVRSGKFPDLSQVGTAGSFFKNPIVASEVADKLRGEYPDLVSYEVDDNKTKISLGYVLDKICGLKGHCRDGVCLYEKQALVLVNTQAESAEVIENFAKEIEIVVEEKTGIKIEREVRSV